MKVYVPHQAQTALPVRSLSKKSQKTTNVSLTWAHKNISGISVCVCYAAMLEFVQYQ